MLPTNSHELTQLGSGPGCGYDSCAMPGRHEWTGIGNATPVTDPGLWRPPTPFFRPGWKPVRADALSHSAASAPERPSRWLRKVFRTSSACYAYGSLTVGTAFARSSIEVLEV